MRAKRWRELFLLCVCAMVFAGAGPAFADECDQVVVDSAGVFGAGLARVEAATQEMVSEGAIVRVRTVDTFRPSASLEARKAQIQKACPSWQAMDGGMKNNLLVFMVAVKDHKTGIYYGDLWKGVVEPQAARIQGKEMNPRFKDGDFAGGMVAGITKVRELITAAQAPPSAQRPAVIVTPPSEPVDLSGLWTVLMWALIIAALGLAAWFAHRFWSGYASAREANRAAQQRMRLAQKNAAAYINRFPEELAVIQAEAEGCQDIASPDNRGPLNISVAKAGRLADRAAQEYAELDGSIGDSKRDSLTTAEYKQIASAYENVVGQLREADMFIADAKKQVRKLRQDAERVPGVIAGAQSALEQAKQRIAEAATLGFKAAKAEEYLADAETSIVNAVAFNGRKEAHKAIAEAEKAKALAEQAGEAARAVSETKRTVENQLSALAARLGQTRKLITETKSVFDGIAAKYAESTWESVRGNGTEAAKRFAKSVQAHEAAADAASMERQDWEQALAHMASANTWLSEIESLMHSIAALAESLRTAREDAVREIQLAYADIAKAKEYIQAHGADIRDGLEDDLKGAERNLKAAEDELGKEKPDYFRIIQLAKRINAAADEMLASARQEREANERLREKAKTAVNNMQSAISRAKEYIEDHRSDVGKRAKNFLRQAEELSSQAGSADLAAVVNVAEDARLKAKKAYSEAKEDVDSAHASSASSWGSYPTTVSSPREKRSEEENLFPRFGSPDRGASIDLGLSDRSEGISTDWGVSSGGGGVSTDW